MADNEPQITTKSIVSTQFESVKTMFEGFNTERKLTYADTADEGYGSGDPLVNGTFHVFITVPDLNLDPRTKTGKANRGFLGIGSPFARLVLAEQLYQSGRLGGNFIKLFSNTALNAPFQDINVDTSEVSENWDGIKLTIAKDHNASTQSGTLSLRLRELDGNPNINTLNIWHNYIIAVTKGMVSPSAKNLDNRILDYAASMYVFSLAADNTTINYAAKYSGVFPTGVPAAAGSNEMGGNSAVVELDVPFAFNFYETMNAAILEDFNRSSKYMTTGGPDFSMAVAVAGRGDKNMQGNKAYLRFKGTIPYVSVNVDSAKDSNKSGGGKTARTLNFVNTLINNNPLSPFL